MKKNYFTLAAIVCSLFLAMVFSSCGKDNPLLNLDDVVKSDLTGPLFLAYDNTLGATTKKIWAFNETEAAKGTITVVGDDILRIQTDWFFSSWSYVGNNLTLKGEETKSYNLKKVNVLTYSAIAFSNNYVCIPSSNRSIDNVNYENEWLNRGLTKQAFWDALRKSNAEKTSVDIKLNN
jgi:hypothetical protein